MIKTSITKRKKEVKELLSEVGMNFREDKDWNTFQVWPNGDKRGGLSTHDTLGRSAADLEDALRSGLDMARRLKKSNPRCRIFQVKRKVGKKTIQVRRKVCNPKGDFDSYYEGSPYFQFLYDKYGATIDLKSARNYAKDHDINFSELELKRKFVNGYHKDPEVDTLEFVKELRY